MAHPTFEFDINLVLGEQNGPVWLESGSFETYMLNSGHSKQHNHTSVDAPGNLKKIQPLAGAGYKFYRDVVEYGADNTGETDATEAINAAIGDGKRCGLECGNTFVQGAIIYFPPGTYKICRPVIQLYYTQFIGDALNPPTIKGCDTFQGIALFDTDPYIPGGNGQNWYINQNQFFRQIRNFIFDLTEMPLTTDDHDQPLVPTGIHWQVSQACSLQNLVFNMPEATDDNKVTHVGIFMENGSGGFVSDLEFNGGNIGWRAGSQQYTAMNLKFNGCLTAVQMIWSWGFNWQRIEVDGGAIAFNISGRGGSTGQGIGSVSIIDSRISNCPIAILTNTRKDGVNGSPNIVIDNLAMYNVETTVQSDNGDVILKGTDFVKLWAIGRRYNGYNGTYTAGEVDAPRKGSGLLNINGKLFYQPRPQYEDLRLDQFLIATEHGCMNDGTGDNTADINSFLEKANRGGKVAYFPAGIYRVGGTVLIPTGSRVQGASWSQIQGAGVYFNDLHNPRVVVQVGERGDVGSMEIVDMMFTTQGATAGAIVLEWNVHQDRQGSAAMWDSHVRVGGALGTDLDVKTCPKFEFRDACICASLLFHVTPQASGYFENVWIWLADHDNDMSVYDSPDKLSNQISLYAARGTLIESEGPSWFYGTGSEHTVMYQYQLYGAKNIYLGHIQTETPYYQPVPIAPLPFVPGKEFPGDPSFEKCKTIGCQAAWGLRIINSKSITLHSSGLYSFFQEYYQDCVPTHNCQERSLEVRGSKGVALFNIFTVGMVEIGTGINVGRDNIITYPQKEPTKCEKKSASICATTVFKATTTRGTITSTSSSTSSTCDTIYGCSASDWDTTTTRTKPDNCPSPTAKPGQAAARPPIPPWGCPANALVYPSDMDDVRHIRELLAKYKDKYVEVKSEALHFTVFFWVPYLDQETMNTLVESPDVADAFYYEHRPDNDGILTDLRGRVRDISYNVDAIKSHGQGGVNHSNDSVVAQGNGNVDQLMPSALITRESNYIWDLSQISMPRGMIWKDPYSATLSANGQFMFHYDRISGEDQYIYIMDEDEVSETHPEMTHHNDIEYLRPDDRYSDPGPARPDVEHGTGVASKVIGRNLGSCQRCTLIVSSLFEGVDEQDESVTLARYLDQVRGVIDDVLLKNRMGKAVINISANFDPTVGVVFIRELHKLLVELDGLNVAIVVSASNRADESPEIDRYPALFAKPGSDLYIPNLIVVGATDAHGHITDFSQYADWMTTFAPGDNIWIPLGDMDYMTSSGTSYSAPFVSGLIGYFRSLPSPWVNQLKDPGSVKKMIKLFHRRIVVSNEPINVHKMKPIIWNGQFGEYSCLSDYRTVEQWDPRGYCPKIKLDLHEETNDGETVAPCRYDSVVLDNSLKRFDGSYCPRLPKTGPSGHTVSFTSNGRVKPSPTCASGTGCGGRLCTGFFCSTMPTGVPPDRHEASWTRETDVRVVRMDVMINHLAAVPMPAAPIVTVVRMVVPPAHLGAVEMIRVSGQGQVVVEGTILAQNQGLVLS
ncbi:hypothetical protein ACO22_05936 [Paracoccidioides brasiliensis]|uniref:Glucan 1,3-beta-glucosidase n=1 Tax=Paracoccidioides brasiliensis TaxID=121759 RepID=A0A1D2J8V1_PARBR|nr:hypothetical protein ACO22_05936 [Paracoccidioides brasiliensis]